MIMKKKLLFLVLTVLSVGMLFGCSSDTNKSSDGEVKTASDKFVVGLDDSFPPMGFRSESGEIVGFDIDLAKATAEKMGMEVEFKAVDWDGVNLSLEKGDIDVIWNGYTITDERKEAVAFTDPYLANRQVLVVKKDSDYAAQSDLKDKVLGIQLGSSAEKALDSNAEFKDSLKEVTKYSNNTEALMDLDSNRVDVVLVDEIVARYFIAKKEGQYKVLDQDLGKEEYGVATRKSDTEFLNKLNTALKEVINSEKGAEISKTWFNEDILVKQK